MPPKSRLYKDNKDANRQRQRRANLNSQIRAAEDEKHRQRSKEYYAKNKETINAGRRAKYRAQKEAEDADPEEYEQAVAERRARNRVKSARKRTKKKQRALDRQDQKVQAAGAEPEDSSSDSEREGGRARRNLTRENELRNAQRSTRAESEFVSDAEMDAMDALSSHVLPRALRPDTQRRIRDAARAGLARPARVCAVCDIPQFLAEPGKDTEYHPKPGAWCVRSVEEMKRHRDLLCKPKDAAELDPLLASFYTVDPELRGLLLSSRGVFHAGQEMKLRVCSTCERSLSSDGGPARTPKFAIANGFYVGQLPENLRDITATEFALLSPIPKSTSHLHHCVAPLSSHSP